MTLVLLFSEGLTADWREVDDHLSLLSAVERDRATRFHFERDRRRFIMRRAKLRLLLAREIGGRPEALAFTETDHGKPSLPDGPHFSLSHSGEHMMLAIADIEVGCDIEWIDAALDWPPLAETFFTPDERQGLSALPDAPARRAFFDCWARKEAFVKALGLGLSYPLDAFDVSLGAEAQLLRGGDGWTMQAVDGGPHCAGALVVRGLGRPLDIRMAKAPERLPC